MIRDDNMKKKRRGYSFNSEWGCKRHITNIIKKMTNRLKFSKKKRHTPSSYFVYKENKLRQRIMVELLIKYGEKKEC